MHHGVALISEAAAKSWRGVKNVAAASVWRGVGVISLEASYGSVNGNRRQKTKWRREKRWKSGVTMKKWLKC